MVNTNEKKIFLKNNFAARGNKIFWVVAIFVGRSERGNFKPNCMKLWTFSQ
jgi:hypothetical protein